MKNTSFTLLSTSVLLFHFFEKYFLEPCDFSPVWIVVFWACSITSYPCFFHLPSYVGFSLPDFWFISFFSWTLCHFLSIFLLCLRNLLCLTVWENYPARNFDTSSLSLCQFLSPLLIFLKAC